VCVTAVARSLLLAWRCFHDTPLYRLRCAGGLRRLGSCPSTKRTSLFSRSSLKIRSKSDRQVQRFTHNSAQGHVSPRCSVNSRTTLYLAAHSSTSDSILPRISSVSDSILIRHPPTIRHNHCHHHQSSIKHIINKEFHANFEIGVWLDPLLCPLPPHGLSTGPASTLATSRPPPAACDAVAMERGGIRIAPAFY
jgi:hypothetical protein